MRIWRNHRTSMARGKAALTPLKNPGQFPSIRSRSMFPGPVFIPTHSRSQHNAPKLREESQKCSTRFARLNLRSDTGKSRSAPDTRVRSGFHVIRSGKHSLIDTIYRLGFCFPGIITRSEQGTLGKPASHRFVARDRNNSAAQPGLELAHITDRDLDAAVLIHDIREPAMVR